jgi:hypothetical protein
LLSTGLPPSRQELERLRLRRREIQAEQYKAEDALRAKDKSLQRVAVRGLAALHTECSMVVSCLEAASQLLQARAMLPVCMQEANLTEADARQRVIQQSHVICATLSSSVCAELVEANLKYDVSPARVYPRATHLLLFRT